MILEDCDNKPSGEETPMFRTGLGNSVVLKKSSVAKASSVLGDDYSDINTGQPCFPGHGFSSPNSMFQTGSGKMVNISSAGIIRAKALLGMDESNDDSNFQGFEPANKKFRGNDMYACEKLSNQVGLNGIGTESSTFFTKVPFHLQTNLTGNEFVDDDAGKLVQPDMSNSSYKPSPIKFHTAGGRSISVSTDALQRARSLLGDPETGSFLDEGDAGASMFSLFKNVSDGKTCNSDGKFFKRSNDIDSSLTSHQFQSSEPNPKIFVSPMRSSFHRKHLEANSEAVLSGTNLLSKFDAEEGICKSDGDTCCLKNPLHEKASLHNTTKQLSASNGLSSGNHGLKRPSGGPLVDITNTMGIDFASKKGITTELRRLGRRSSVSPFKRPRSSKFITPLNTNLLSAPTGMSSRASEASYSRKRVSTHYPFQHSRTYIKDFFRVPPTHVLDDLPEQVRLINPGNSKKYMFCDGSQLIGIEAFYNMLAQSEASMRHASKEWVANHYKWIVWKLASYERCYSTKFMRKFLTISNVLDELKYRYEREVNHGQRSAIKRILEGDASPSSTLVLCVSAIHSDSEIETPSTNGAGNSSIARLELTDGWYSIDAQLDMLLSKHLAVGKLFVGQKLRICGAGLNGWNGPISPLEASSTVNLLLHINGTYRAGWAERLGFCRGLCAPLAFRCVKSNGGPIPRTLVGVTRIYPVLYRERLKNWGCIVRSEKMEAALAQLYNQRCSNLIEGIASDFQRGASTSSMLDDYDNGGGARILKMLESAAEPELLMAEMSSEQLASFSTYRAKMEASRQFDLQRLIETALQDAGLSAREVTPFMRVRVVGLKYYGQSEAKDPREGLITIWNPTESHKLELAEGQAYTISGLIPLHSDLNTLYLQARGSSTKWQTLTTKEKESFVPFFKPRKPVLLSRIGEVPLSSEFDTAVLVLHVGMEYIAGQQKRQWVFVTDGSLCELQTEESTISLLAISFCSPCTEDDSISPINFNLVGSIVGFCNLVKRTKDHANHMWVAEATENSTYYLNCDHPYCSHLKHAFALVQKWQQSSSLTVEKLREKVLCIVAGPKG